MIQRKFKIAVAPSRKSLLWRNEEWTWEKLAERLSNAKDTGEKYEEYMNKFKPAEQASTKDVGGFVGGYLRGGRRLMANLVSRSMLTLDVDYGSGGFRAWEAFKMNYACAACMYTTHKHSAQKPRYRIVIPLNQDITPDMYGALSRFIASELGIEDFDDSTYEPHRLMYWPSRATDGEFYAETWPPTRDFSELTDGNLMDPECELAYHESWQDVSTWPVSSRTQTAIRTESRKAADPREKPYPIGPFCRAYDVPAAITAFLQDVYTPAGEGRYTYTKGSSACGLTLMEDGRLCYSHHSTDPANGSARNSFDLVRIHLFGHLDADTDEDCKPTQLPSYVAMGDFARDDDGVKAVLAADREAEFQEFKAAISADGVPAQTDKVTDAAPAQTDKVTDAAPAQTAAEANGVSEQSGQAGTDGWDKKLKKNKAGKCDPTCFNLELIFHNDPHLKGAFRRNKFSGKLEVTRYDPVWHRTASADFVPGKDNLFTNADEAGLRSYIETRYDIYSPQRVTDVLDIAMAEKAYHPVCDYLDSLRWDGEPRLDTVLVDYLGAADTEYVRTVTRKVLVAAVARVREPGCKFDNVLTLVGGQGIGKSEFVKRMACNRWCNDSLQKIDDIRAYEALRGFWFVELPELSSFKRAELETIKQFLSKREDSYRPAFAHRMETFYRQCIFVGTTNVHGFLRDPTGDRRFWPVDVCLGDRLTVFDDLTPSVVDQIWAEADTVYRSGTEVLYLNGRQEQQAKEAQREHTEDDPRLGALQEWLDTPIPADFDNMSRADRLAYYDNYMFSCPTACVRRDLVSVNEINAECFHDRLELTRSRANSNEIISLLRRLGWTKCGSKRTKAYGPQQVYARPTEQT